MQSPPLPREEGGISPIRIPETGKQDEAKAGSMTVTRIFVCTSTKIFAAKLLKRQGVPRDAI